MPSTFPPFFGTVCPMNPVCALCSLNYYSKNIDVRRKKKEILDCNARTCFVNSKKILFIFLSSHVFNLISFVVWRRTTESVARLK